MINATSAKLVRRVRDQPLVDALVKRHGPGVRRVPAPMRRRLVRQAQLPGRPGVRTEHLSERRERFDPPPAHVIGGASTLSRLAQRTQRMPLPFLAELADVTLVGRHAVPVTADGRVLLTGFRDSAALLGMEPHPDLEAWFSDPVSFDTLATVETPLVSLVGRLDVNYFHWLIDACAGFEPLATLVHPPSVLIRADASPFMMESLSLLGIDLTRIVTWPLQWATHGDDAAVAMPVRRLIVPSWRGRPQAPSPRSTAWLRHTFLTAAGARPAADLKLYIQRRPDGWRTVANEPELLDFLGGRGFTVVAPEPGPLESQIALFARASVIVGMHGAGLTNVLFSPRARLIELVGDYGTPEYYSLCAGLQNPYTRVQCATAGDDIHVDVATLARALDA